MRIDSHQHFWQYDPVRDAWINDDMKAIQRDFLPADLAPILQKHQFDGCVAVQASQSEEESNFLLALAKENAFIKGVVGWVDLMADNIDERLDYFAAFPTLKGFRHVVQGESDPEFMLRPKFRAGIAALEAYNFTYDILIYHHQLEQAIRFVKLFPEQPFVLDHIAKPDIKNGELDEWKIAIQKLALHENVYCKISGMVTEADWQHWKPSDFTAYLDTVVKAFGTERLMFGSDWPVCLVAAEYDKMLDLVTSYFSTFTKFEQKQIFGDNAAKFYRL